MIKRILALLICLVSFTTGRGQELVSSEFLGLSTTTLINFLGSPLPVDYDVNFYKLTYTTTDIDGSETVASGAIAVPATNECNVFPMVSYCHGTVLRRFDVPSEQNFESFLPTAFAAAGYIALAPDYLGLGEDEGVHPYVHAESQATATLDMISAAREFLETTDISDNGEVFITGYSQGGHAAMATVKYAQDNDLLDELGIVAGAPLSGPYNMSGTQSEIILSDLPYSNPGYIIYLLVSYEAVYGNIYNELGDIIQSPYDEQVAPYFDGEQNEFNMSTVNALLPSLVEDLMVDTVLTNFENNPNHPLRLALIDNDNFDWTPSFPLRMFYCDGDEQVFFENSVDANTAMNSNGASDVDAINILPGADHGGCVLPAILGAYEFFEEFASECESTLTTSDLTKTELVIFPNPAKDEFRLTGGFEHGTVRIFDISGKVVLEEINYSDNQSLNIAGIPTGNYVVSVEENKATYSTLLVISR